MMKIIGIALFTKHCLVNVTTIHRIVLLSNFYILKLQKSRGCLFSERQVAQKVTRPLSYKAVKGKKDNGKERGNASKSKGHVHLALEQDLPWGINDRGYSQSTFPKYFCTQQQVRHQHPSLENKSFNKHLGMFLLITHSTDAQLHFTATTLDCDIQCYHNYCTSK